ncbi:MAG: hypothetical protein GX610_00665 [Rhodococcus sp.]|nr:hypothetical protein [Rhodococcus sp. (in: high G+C Gram-positive bacteria)]
MTNPGRQKAQRRPKRSASQMIVAGLLTLAVVASLFLIFSDSVPVLRVGLVLAVWAAVLGTFAVTKYRRETALERAKVNDLQKVYELQLEREITARREYELTVEKRVRSEVRADSEELAALRAELSALRKNLEVLFDGAIPAERTALRADSTRVQELAGGSYSSYQPAASGLYIPGSGGNQADSVGSRAYPQSAPSGQRPATGYSFASPDDAPVTAETAVVPAEYRSNGYPRDGRVQDAEVAEVEDVVVEDVRKNGVGAEPAHPEPEADVPAREVVPEPEPEAEADASSGAHSSGLTVAQIMANLNAESSSASGSGGRRRRRAE